MRLQVPYRARLAATTWRHPRARERAHRRASHRGQQCTYSRLSARIARSKHATAAHRSAACNSDRCALQQTCIRQRKYMAPSPYKINAETPVLMICLGPRLCAFFIFFKRENSVPAETLRGEDGLPDGAHVLEVLHAADALLPQAKVALRHARRVREPDALPHHAAAPLAVTPDASPLGRLRHRNAPRPELRRGKGRRRARVEQAGLRQIADAAVDRREKRLCARQAARAVCESAMHQRGRRTQQ